jgi:beta-galactosidase
VGRYTAITRNRYGKGEVTYVGFMPGDSLIGKIPAKAIDRTQVAHIGADIRFPLILRSGVNRRGRALHYTFNYSATPQTIAYPFSAGTELLSSKATSQGARVDVAPWGVDIVEDAAP